MTQHGATQQNRRRARDLSARAGRVMLAAGAGAALVLAGCSSPGTPTSDVSYQPAGLSDATALEGVLAANDALGLAMLAERAEGNVVVSPFSAYVALAMLAEGARGATASAFDDALGAAGADRTAAVSALRDVLLAYDGDPSVVAADEPPAVPVLHLADRVVIDESLAPEQAYLDVLARSYDAAVATGDLGGATGKAELDAWVSEHTGGLVKESAIVPNGDLKLVLQDAVVLAAAWQEPFLAEVTRPREFLTAEGEIDVETMFGSSENAWGVWEHDGATVVRLPYTEGFLADVVLPAAGTDPASLDLAALTALRTGEGLTSVAAPGSGEVQVSLPKFDLAPEPLDLLPVLDAVGLGELQVAPDLSGLAAQDLVVGQALQQARFRLDEAGTVAAAVTEIGMEAGAQPGEIVEPVVVTVDRPFLVRVWHEETGLTLFLAAVRDPSAS